ncbi:MAG: MarR family transcriptional regulator [Acidobacteria bacterium]|nr:MarR family transcriptional regulator [Acidobacteriota bacterium]
MPTRFHGTEAERRALDTYIKLMRAAESVTARLSRGVREAGLTTTQLGVLEALLHLGPMAQCELASKQLKSPANLTTVVDNLERRNLVRRQCDPGDRRRWIVDLTPEGRSLIADFFPGHAAAVTRELSVLTPSEQDRLARLCRKLGLGNADAHPHGPDRGSAPGRTAKESPK